MTDCLISILMNLLGLISYSEMSQLVDKDICPARASSQMPISTEYSVADVTAFIRLFARNFETIRDDQSALQFFQKNGKTLQVRMVTQEGIIQSWNYSSAQRKLIQRGHNEIIDACLELDEQIIRLCNLNLSPVILNLFNNVLNIRLDLEAGKNQLRLRTKEEVHDWLRLYETQIPARDAVLHLLLKYLPKISTAVHAKRYGKDIELYCTSLVSSCNYFTTSNTPTSSIHVLCATDMPKLISAFSWVISYLEEMKKADFYDSASLKRSYDILQQFIRTNNIKY